PTWPLRSVARSRGTVADGQGTVERGEKSSGVQPAPGTKAPMLRWSLAEARAEPMACNGCGQCRTEAPARRMCPIFRATHGEDATPRAKANLMRYLLGDGLDPQKVGADEVREVADLCVNCKMCASECPAHVNVPKMMLEAKAANVAEHGLG